ncbi:hypothetical protein [Pseudonocardia xishanensis]|uniref:Uncharacterized protein n=1 Tax=Pseudonocardia xishanensis TaxID=630995 RepID=A0ABP8RLN4_9PSEU
MVRPTVVRAGEACTGRQGPDYAPGISADSVGALWLGSVLSPHGGRTRTHVREDHESAFFLEGDEQESVRLLPDLDALVP